MSPCHDTSSWLHNNAQDIERVAEQKEDRRDERNDSREKRGAQSKKQSQRDRTNNDRPGKTECDRLTTQKAKLIKLK